MIPILKQTKNLRKTVLIKYKISARIREESVVTIHSRES